MRCRGKKVELVAPAGNLEKLRYAYAYGADGAYIGWKKYSLRNMADNFSLAGLRKAISLKERLKKKLYLALNVFPRNRHILEIASFLKKMKDLSLDGLIVSDIGVLHLCRSLAPSIPVHISTQANVMNRETVRAFRDLGARRIVLARELAISEIAGMKKGLKTLEVEVFIHGALCLSYSGRCHLSSYLTKREANMGECTHSCRWKYFLVEENRPGEYFPVEISREKETYILNPRDLCLLFLVPQMIRSGVDSFKIEGRMKGIHYIATTVKAYRKVIDFCYSKDCSYKNFLNFSEDIFFKELLPLQNRSYTADFAGQSASSRLKSRMERLLNKKPDNLHKFFALYVRSGNCPDKVQVFLKNRLVAGTDLYFKSPSQDILGPLKVTRIHDMKGQEIDFGRAGEKVWLELSRKPAEQLKENGIFFSVEKIEKV